MNISKVVKVSTLTVGLMVSVGVFAAGVSVSDGDIVAFDGTTCVDATNRILTQNVPVNLSKNVFAAYECLLADATQGTVNHVNIGACHIGGTAKARNVQCSADPNVPGQFIPTGCADATGTVPVTGIAFFRKSTAGGQLIADGMGTTQCNANGIAGLVDGLE